MTTRREGVINLLLKKPGLSDREITNHLEGKKASPQPFNQLCRRLENEGILVRKKRKDGIIGNFPVKKIIRTLEDSDKNLSAKKSISKRQDNSKSDRKPLFTQAPYLTDISKRRIILISCVKSKLDHPAKAKDFYTSPLFQKSMAYALKLKPDAIYILSAKYGLVGLDQVIQPYEKTLKTMTSSEKKAWAASILNSLRKYANLNSDLFIILAGEEYRKYLLPGLKHYEIPLKGLSQGLQLQELNRRLIL